MVIISDQSTGKEFSFFLIFIFTPSRQVTYLIFSKKQN